MIDYSGTIEAGTLRNCWVSMENDLRDLQPYAASGTVVVMSSRLDGQCHTCPSVLNYMTISLGARSRQLQNKNFPSDHKTQPLTPDNVGTASMPRVEII